MNPEAKQDILTQGGYNSVPAWLVLAHQMLLDVPLDEWLKRASLFVLLLNASFLVWTWRRRVLRDRAAAALYPTPPTTDSAHL